MRQVNIHEAKTHLSQLVDQAAQGEGFVIAKAGRPLVQVMPLDHAARAGRNRLGFLVGEISVPEDFDRLGGEEIATLFEAGR
ncbi:MULTISPECIES: type II toxin-antitoxin system Phd/YefM family antitoxin [Roseomonadaceae]|uniref:Antitoxin n=1 Tax=Falsiroseomonas oleicola TaxID=2801474 RepID=A0ABS6H0F2_9PROT|nr:type II toxin-antitoxin system prevent-host-death family antitoxin [Roseomonas oleicola]MBU8542139.1 type II toxin-antitoxin system prevent-host-death family antitoxin [Roseomonas oleicola]